MRVSLLILYIDALLPAVNMFLFLAVLITVVSLIRRIDVSFVDFKSVSRSRAATCAKKGESQCYK